MRCRTGYSGRQGETNVRPDSPRKGKASKDRSHDHGTYQAILHARIRKRRRHYRLIPTLALARNLNPLPNLDLYPTLSLPWSSMIRVVLPFHLRILASVTGEVQL